MIFFSSSQLQLDKWGPSVNIDHFLSEHECSKIIALMPERKLTEALVSEVGVKNTSIRSTKLCELEYNEKTQWIFKKLEQAITQVNYEIYGAHILGIKESVQLMSYGIDGHYSWHSDTSNGAFSRRKLSFTVQLSDENEYDGGELEFFQNGIAPKQLGTLILFPSYLYHRVCKVTRGLRRSLTGWTDGPPYS